MTTGRGGSGDRSFDEGQLMAHDEIQSLVGRLSTRGNEDFLFELGFAIREAAERASRDAERARRAVEHSDDPDRSFHDGRAAAYRFVVGVMQQQADAFEIPLQELARDGIDPDADLG